MNAPDLSPIARQSVWAEWPKRAVDVLVSAMALLIFSIPLLIVACLVRLRLGSPILFRQMRPGLGGQPFELLKFRTMLDKRDSSGALVPETQRLTNFGRWLRASSLDELPELWNVLRGDMSLIGPRPLLVDYLPYYTPQQMRRHEMRPGLTGWAQINGRNTQSWDERLSHDLYYVEHASLGLDLRILRLTIWRVLTRHGINASSEASMPRFDDEVRAGRAVGRLPDGMAR